MNRRTWLIGVFLVLASSFALLVGPFARAQDRDRTQLRSSGERVEVPVDRVIAGDGDTIVIEWGEDDREVVRILGIDTPEVRNPDHNLPFDQPFGREASAFARGAWAATQRMELLRADMTDGYGRTLGYIFIDGRNYSELVVRARLAYESVTHYGDNGFPQEAAAVLAAAEIAGTPPFEPPYQFRRRMRDVANEMRARGELPPQTE